MAPAAWCMLGETVRLFISNQNSKSQWLHTNDTVQNTSTSYLNHINRFKYLETEKKKQMTNNNIDD